MSHLTLEALARLLDEAPTRDEREHLEGCAACRAELQALEEERAELASLPALEPSADAWPELEVRLRDEGLIRHEDRWSLSPGWMRAAAAALLFFVGGASGFAMRGMDGAGTGPVTGGAGNARLVADRAPQSVEDAERAVQRAQEAYLAALSDYAELTNEPTVGDPAARLAALDNIVLTTQAALDEAPADPVLNGYLFTALAQRDAMTRELARGRNDPWF